MFAIAAVVYVGVVAFLLLGMFRRRHHGAETDGTPPMPGAFSGTPLIIGGGVILPVVVLVPLFAGIVLTMRSLRDETGPQDLQIQVTGRQWFWDVNYPQFGIRTANEIHIPAGRRVEVQVTSRDVIHSFWVPELSGKIDVLPDRTNSMWIEADQPGTYRGECAEFCGLQHANMAFVVIAQSQQDFDAWTAQQSQPAPFPADAHLLDGEQVFLGSACVYCHTVRGTNASGEVGPDLTHLASREYLAAGTVQNTKGALAGWILNPQSIKPGNKMPGTALDADELNALLDYLETLK
jgi:cytochrome c oxidase subunit 2